MKILAIQNRMGIGDMVIFLPFIEAIAKKYKTTVSILVKENSKAAEIFKNNKYIENIIILERNNKTGLHDGLFGSFNLIKNLKQYNFEKVFIFNSSLRFNLIARLSGIKNIYQYPLFKKKNQHIIDTAKNFIISTLDLNIDSNPIIELEENIVEDAKKKFNINTNQINILLGIGGSGSTKRIPSKIFISFMNLLINKYDCRFFLATGNNKDEQLILKEILNTNLNDKCFSLDQFQISDTLPIIKNCKIAVCNDSSFSHLSAALGIPTIVLMSDTPLMYGSYSPRMYPIIPDGEKTVSHDTLGKDKINPEKIFQKFSSLLD